MTMIPEDCECVHCLSWKRRIVVCKEKAQGWQRVGMALLRKKRRRRNARAVAILLTFLACWAIVAFDPEEVVWFIAGLLWWF